MSQKQTSSEEKQVRILLKDIKDYTADYTSSLKCDEIMHLLVDGHATPHQEKVFKEYAENNPEDRSCLELYLTIRELVREKANKHYQRPVPLSLTEEIMNSVQILAKAS